MGGGLEHRFLAISPHKSEHSESPSIQVANFASMILTQSGILLYKEVVLRKSTHVKNKVWWQFRYTVPHPSYLRTHDFRDGLTIELLQYIEKWNLKGNQAKQLHQKQIFGKGKRKAPNFKKGRKLIFLVTISNAKQFFICHIGT